MEDQYGMNDLRQFITSSSNNRPNNNNLYAPIPHPYDMLLFGTDPNTNTNTSVTNASTSIGGASSSVVVGGGEFSAFESGGGGVGGDGSNGRWPRQETLTLLEIRSRLDIKFKEANQKGPLWDEVSRIMSEEHGYQRSGKKCREKFENLYKYYKKTKEGKAGRQDGKHYRFFRQLEALYGETNNSASVLESNLIGGNFQDNIFQNKNISLANNQESFPEDTSLNLSNFDDSYTTSSDDSDFNEGVYGNDQNKMKRKCKRSWKVKIKDFIDAKMRILMDKQEAWMERMMTSIEKKEQERILREEEWRKQDAARIEREQKFWANERAWIEARDSELMDALQKLTGKELRPSTPEELIMASNIRSMSENPNEDGSDQTMNNNSVKVLFAGRSAHPGTESEVNRLIQLRNAMEVKFQQGLISEEVLWEEIASKMACFGHEKSGLMCKEMWDSVNEYILKCNKKRKENSKGYQNHELFCDQLGGRGYCDTSEQAVNHTIMRLNDNMNSPLNSNTGNAINDGCFRYFVGDPYGRIMD